ncbi:hypothetical protein BAE44_0011850 [Dichanthelium oligosanthes]|uniref:RanBP2-type domain-containing protein n=1 Tax=Dichanthelium oligosanthes TaxID=888268 RepID=A0A1E5VPZ6_9POAL|nr:hypothetical protein BAE44_0011850 [Dichanthelium oligosanthes]
MPSPSPSPPPSLGAPAWSCAQCTFSNPICSDSCEICEAARPLEVDADSPVVVVSAPASTPPRRLRRMGDRAPAVVEAELPVEVDADSPIVVGDASASPPLRQGGRRRERAPEVSEAKRPVEVDADGPIVMGDASASHPLRQCGRKRERAPEVSDAEHPVEVDAGSPVAVAAAPASTPPRRCGRKRERAASPDVVELCDSAGRGGGGDGEVKAPAAKKANLEIHLNKKTFKIMTYNVWFREDMELSRRMDALGDLIKHHSPDFICFQEVTPYIHLLMQKSEWWQQYKCLLSQEMAILKPYYCMQLSKVSVEQSECIPLPNSIMGRELCITSVSTGEMTKLVLATTHLESPCPAPPKWDQMYSKERICQAKKSLEILGHCRNAILCGDMNWDDKGDGPFPLQDGWTDAWVELKPGEDGWTYDTKANGMLSGSRKLQKRMDRFLCKLQDFKIDSIEMIGKEAIPGVSYFKEKKVRKEFRKIELPVFPSDHFGLVLTITKQGDGSF